MDITIQLIFYDLKRAINYSEKDDEFKAFPGARIKEIYEKLKQKYSEPPNAESDIGKTNRLSITENILISLGEALKRCQGNAELATFPGEDIKKLKDEFSSIAIKKGYWS
jgi:L-arabinose isomerase